MTTFCAVPYSSPLVLMVVESNHSFYFVLGHSTFSAKFRLNMWGQSEAFSISIYTSTASSWVFTILCKLGHALFVGFSIRLCFFIPFTMLVGWMVHVHSINFTFYIVLGVPPSIFSFSVNIFLWFIDSPGFKILSTST